MDGRPADSFLPDPNDPFDFISGIDDIRYDYGSDGDSFDSTDFSSDEEYGPPPRAGRGRAGPPRGARGGRAGGRGRGGGHRGPGPSHHGGGPHGGTQGYGPWHHVLFALFGTELECQGEGSHVPGGACEREMRAALIGTAEELGYQGPRNVQAVQHFLMPYREEVIADTFEGIISLGCEVIMPERGPGGAPGRIQVRDVATGEIMGGRHGGGRPRGRGREGRGPPGMGMGMGMGMGPGYGY